MLRLRSEVKLTECSKAWLQSFSWIASIILTIFLLPPEEHGPLTLEKFLKDNNVIITKEQLELEIEEHDLIYLAQHFDTMELYLRAFDLNAAEQADVRRFVITDGTQVAMSECLRLWKKHAPSTATLGALLQICIQLRKEEVVLKLCYHYFPKDKLL